jgi:hypothetical protein
LAQVRLTLFMVCSKTAGQEVEPKKFLTRSRESAIPQGNPKIGRGANSCALKPQGSAIDSKGEMSLGDASRWFKE